MIGNNFIFIECPKTATTSIRQWLLDHHLADPEINNLFQRHYDYLSICECLGSYPEFTFSVVRNPYSRFVSEYFYLKQLAESPDLIGIGNSSRKRTEEDYLLMNPGYLHLLRQNYKKDSSLEESPHTLAARKFFSSKPSFSDFAKNLLNSGAEFPYGHLKATLQSNFIIGESRRLEFYGYGKRYPEWWKQDGALLRLENLDFDFVNLCKSQGWPNDPLPKSNTSYNRKKPWQEYYDRESIEAVNLFFKKDFVNFEYPMVNSTSELYDL